MAASSAAPRTAILLFTHAPAREWENKRLVPGDIARSRDVAVSLVAHARSVVQASGLPVRVISSDRQRGTSFGERFVNALADVFAEGFDQVIAVGNDCPQLGEVDFAAVERTLQNGRPVVGPTPKGGTYLIGLRRGHFDPHRLQQLPYQTAAFCDALMEHLTRQAAMAPVQLAARTDLNSLADLQQLLADRPQGTAAQLAAQLQQLFEPNEPPRERSRHRPPQYVAHPESGRGPPLLYK